MGEMWSPEPAPSKLRRARKPRLRIPEANRGMTRHVLRRLMLALPTLWLVLASLLTRVVPGAPVERMPGEGATPFPKLSRGPSPEARPRWQKVRGQNDW